METTSEIRNITVVEFGGNIQISIGHCDEDKTSTIRFRECIEPRHVGDPAFPDDKVYSSSVHLIFKNIESIECVRAALDRVQYHLENYNKLKD